MARRALRHILRLQPARAGEKCLYFAFEEAPAQIVRMRSIGLDLDPHVKKGLLKFYAARSTMQGLEMHLATFHRLIEELKPSVVVFDPVSNLMQAGEAQDATAMLTRLIDYLKMQKVTAFMTTLTSGGEELEQTSVDISSLVDTWMLVRDIELAAEPIERCMS